MIICNIHYETSIPYVWGKKLPKKGDFISRASNPRLVVKDERIFTTTLQPLLVRELVLIILSHLMKFSCSLSTVKN